MTDFFDIVSRQRAHRAFSGEPVSDDDIAAVLRAATFAPSAENRQPWEFVVVRAPATRAAIGEIARRRWDAHGRAFAENRLDPKLLDDVDQGMRGGIAEAPAIVVVCADTERGLEQSAPSSIFPAVQNLLLAATALGLGSALTTLTTYARDDLRALLALPDHVLPIAVVPLGHPARPLGRPRREPFDAHTHRERYGERWTQ